MSPYPSPRKVNLVGSRIRELRKGHHLTQTELSDKIGIAQSDLSRMEQGEYKVGLDTLFKLLQVFDLKIGEFFGESETAGPEDRDLEDLFTCNRATTLLEMDRQDFDLSALKEILLRSPASPNGVLAAYASAHAHEVRGETSRAAFYAQAALQKSRDLGLEEWTAASMNLLANLELRESRFESAKALFEEALDRLEARGDRLS